MARAPSRTGPVPRPKLTRRSGIIQPKRIARGEAASNGCVDLLPDSATHRRLSGRGPGPGDGALHGRSPRFLWALPGRSRGGAPSPRTAAGHRVRGRAGLDRLLAGRGARDRGSAPRPAGAGAATLVAADGTAALGARWRAGR